MNLEKIEFLLADEPLYRLKQIEKSLYKDLIESWNDATVLPAGLRGKLEKEVPIAFDFDTDASPKGSSIKVIMRLPDGLNVESVLMKHKGGRNTVCVSSQVGCPLNCIFCRTGKIGYIRNLNHYEIIEQVLFFSYYLKKASSSAKEEKSLKTRETVKNIVFMGMGEPFLNYDNVIKAIRFLNDKDKFNIGARHISVSTAGIPEIIKKFSSENLQVNLAVSLNSPDDKIRRKIMPIAQKYPVKEIIEEVKSYIEKTNRRVMFEYIMIKDLNDSDALAQQLIKLLGDLLCFVNLIPYNGEDCDLKPTPRKRIDRFRNILENGGIAVTERFRFGEDINAACGQLIYKRI
ncbi:MAG: 23S rRNA (adenine(2503)-C(2))-methyltransferase [Actinobacteria bacterium RBG_19FT_COMBO_36_27]|nr:MAG: 23S rRNA (adenine(2503)-C(2))-methyltransferase [Actinobacteria bacterium RBG_19FT_COMBO_36_27]